MTEFKRADGLRWTDQDHEFETLLRAGNLLYWHKDAPDFSEQQLERLNRITNRLGEIVIERSEGGYR